MRSITNKHIIYLFVIITMFTFSSCKKFLEASPSKTSALVVTTAAQLDALLNTHTVFYAEGNRTAIYSSDDYELTTSLYNARPGTFSSMATIQFMLWDTEFLPMDTREGFWSGEFRKIFNANMVLEYLEKVTGTAEEKAILKADAHLIRAYSYWVLANTYCLPFTEANKNEPGLPIKTRTSFEEPLERRPLGEVYAQIEADLEEALKIKLPLIQNGTRRHWRANTAAANGFAARYWLHRNDYDKALAHANNALTEFNQLVDYNTEMRYGRNQVLTINGGTPNAETVTLEYPYTHDNQTDFTDMIGWKEFLYFRMLNHESWWYIPSQDLLDLYDKEHDLRYKYHVVEGYSYDRGMINPAYSYPGYIFFFKDRLPSGPTVAEMILIKSEALARNGDFNTAITTLNSLRQKRMLPGAWVDLTAADKAEAIRHITEERRRELPFSARWFDLRRYNNNEDPEDDVVVTRTFFPYTISSVLSSEPAKQYRLDKNSRRYAAPLPITEMISSQDIIQQNTY